MVITTDTIRIERFSFASFDSSAATATTPEVVVEEISQEPTEIVPPAPVFSEAQLEAARAEAYKKGVEEGRTSAETEQKKEEAAREEMLRKLLEVMANRITLAAEDLGKQLEEQRSSLYPLALTIAKKIAGVALHQDAYAPLEELLQQCSVLVAGESLLTLVVSEEFAEPLRAHLDTLRTFLAGFEGEIDVKPDPSFHGHDCRVEWKKGFMEYNTERLWADIEKLLIPTTAAEG